MSRPSGGEGKCRGGRFIKPCRAIIFTILQNFEMGFVLCAGIVLSARWRIFCTERAGCLSIEGCG